MPRSTPARTCSRSGCRTPTPSRTGRRSSARPRRALAAGATFDRSLALVRRIAAARPGRPARADGLRQPAHRRRRRAGPAQAPGRRGGGRRDRRRPHARRGGAVRARRREAGIAVVYLVAPTTSPERRAAVAARSGGFLYCVSLVGVTGARSSLPASVSGLVADMKAASPVPVAVGFGVSKPAHVRRSPRPAPASSSPVRSSTRSARMGEIRRPGGAWRSCGPRREPDAPPR